MNPFDHGSSKHLVSLKFKLISAEMVVDEHHASNTVTIEGAEWNFHLIRGRPPDPDSKYVGIFLFVYRHIEEVAVKVDSCRILPSSEKVGTVAAPHKINFLLNATFKVGTPNGMGINKAALLADLCNFTYNGELQMELNLEIAHKSVAKELQSRGHLYTKSRLADPQFSDLVITFGPSKVAFKDRKKIKVHKLIMCQHSQFLSNKFSSGMKDSADTVLHIDNFPRRSSERHAGVHI